MKNDKQSICIVEQAAYPSDVAIRTKKIGETFERKGYEVIIIGQNKGFFKPDGKQFSIEDNFNSSLFFIPLPFNIFFAYRIFKTARQFGAKLLIAKSLKVFYPAYLSAKILGIPVVFDIAEYFKGMKDIVGKRPLWEDIIKAPFIVDLIEKLAIYLSDYIWVVVDEQEERLKTIQKKIKVVSNTPTISNTKTPKPEKKAGGFIRIVYSGIISEGRGVQQVVKALAHMPESFAIELLIIGDGIYREKLENLAKEHNVSSKIKFAGWIPSEELPALLASCDIGIIPHKVCDMCNFTIPNKLFNYMWLGMPIISTPNRPIVRIINECACGFIVPEEPKEMAEAICSLDLSAQNLEKTGQQGQLAVKNKYNWETDSNAIIDTVNSLLKKA